VAATTYYMKPTNDVDLSTFHNSTQFYFVGKRFYPCGLGALFFLIQSFDGDKLRGDVSLSRIHFIQINKLDLSSISKYKKNKIKCSIKKLLDIRS
jgi:hypothetical protein